MVKRLLSLTAALLLLVSPALCELTVEQNAGEMYFPNEKNWVYHFTYIYPVIVGEDYTAALINDTYQMALDEMTQLVLPMFANAPDMRYDGRNEVRHEFRVTCNNGRLLSIVLYRSQTRGEDGPLYALEPLTFDVSGMYAGETLTLRGVTLVQAGVDGSMLEDVEPELYPEVANIIDGSSDAMAEVLLPVLYREFQRLQDEGVMGREYTYEDFAAECAPSRDFYAEDGGSIVFFLPPMLLSSPSPNAPCLTFTPAELNALMTE